MRITALLVSVAAVAGCAQDMATTTPTVVGSTVTATAGAAPGTPADTPLPSVTVNTGVAAGGAPGGVTATATTTTVGAAAAAADTCNAAAYQQFVGQKSPAVTLPAGTEMRHYRTGDPVTMDMSPARLNFEYDRTGKLVKVTCG